MYSQETALMTAAYKGNMEILVKLMNRGASVNLTDKVNQLLSCIVSFDVFVLQLLELASVVSSILIVEY